MTYRGTFRLLHAQSGPTFHLTPAWSVCEGDVESVEVLGSEGYLGVLAHHAALVTSLASGAPALRRAGGVVEKHAVTGGFFEVSNDRATVLADSVEAAKAW